MPYLRYTLVPYIYSMAAQQTNDGYTMARLLAFDFADDPNVYDLKDEYMFGHFLVGPVTHPLSESTTRRMYLPKGTAWIDYWTGQRHDGGQWLTIDVPINRLPLFVKAGSIIPTTEVAQYTAAQTKLPVTINIYPGGNARFELYEDEGDSYRFEQGASSLITFSWDEKSHTLNISPCQGTYPGMMTQRQFIIKTPSKQVVVKYKGKQQQVKL